MLGETNSRHQDDGSRRPGTGAVSRGGRTSPTSSVQSGARTKSAPEHRTSFARDVLERLVLSNTKVYASRKQVSAAMREVHQIYEGGTDAQGKAGEGSGRESGGGAAGSSVDRDASGQLESAGEPKEQECITKGKVGGDEQDLRSLKKCEEEVLSVTRYSLEGTR